MIGVLFLLLAGPPPLVEGNAQSEVRVVIYEDLQCSDCADFRRMLDEKLLPRYGTRVAFEHRDFPLPKHKWAKAAAVASIWFQQQRPELAVQWRRTTMANQASITPEALPGLVREFAGKNGLNPELAVQALSDGGLIQIVEKSYEDGVARGIARTPTALVNGDPFIETFSVEEISAAIDRELKAGSKP
jgi:protein-disulfide isomerase